MYVNMVHAFLYLLNNNFLPQLNCYIYFSFVVWVRHLNIPQPQNQKKEKKREKQ